MSKKITKDEENTKKEKEIERKKIDEESLSMASRIKFGDTVKMQELEIENINMGFYNKKDLYNKNTGNAIFIEVTQSLSGKPDKDFETVYDPRGGFRSKDNKGLTCSTCSGDSQTCKGHFLFIKYPVALINPLPVQNSSITITSLKNLMNIFSFCGKHKISTNDFIIYQKKPMEKILEHLAKISKSQPQCNCDICTGKNNEGERSKNGRFSDELFIRGEFERIALENYIKSDIKSKVKGTTPENKIKSGTPWIGCKIQDKEDLGIVPVPSSYIKRFLENINDEMLEIIKFKQAKNILLDVFIITPPNIRPENKSAKDINPHPQTNFQKSIVDNILKFNKIINEVLNKEDVDEVLRLMVPQLQDKKIKRNKKDEKQATESNAKEEASKILGTIYLKYFESLKKSKHENTYSLATELNSKTGSVREASSRRAKQVSRSTIGPGGDYEFDEIGVPERVAKKLSVIEMVIPGNIQKLRESLLNDKIIRIIRNNKELYPQKDFILALGDEVERQLSDGDYILFNRQPSFRESNILAGRVKIHKGLGFWVHTSNAPGYNFDYDGDEMTAVAMSNEDALVEMILKMEMNRSIMSGTDSKPFNRPTFDSLLGSYRMTHISKKKKYHQRIEYSDFENFISKLSSKKQLKSLEKRCAKHNISYNFIENNDVYYYGSVLFSSILPEDFNYFNEKTKVKILDGILVHGSINDNELNKNEGIVQKIKLNYPPKRLGNFITDICRISYYYLEISPFTFGWLQAIPVKLPKTFFPRNTKEEKETRDKKEKEISPENWYYNHVNLLKLTAVIEIISGVLEDGTVMTESNLVFKNFEKINDKKKTVEENIFFKSLDLFKNAKILNKEYETEVYLQTARLTQNVAKLSHEVSNSHQGFRFMMKAGAKATVKYIAELLGIVGQMDYLGKRIYGKTTGRRLTAGFLLEDPDPTNHGFCFNSFTRGQDPTSYLSGQIASRQTLLDTPVVTPETGHIQRLMNMSVGSLQTDDCIAVKNSDGYYSQTLYGNNGFEPKEVINLDGKVDFINVFDIIKDLNSEFGF